MWKKLFIVLLMAIALLIGNPNFALAVESGAIENSAVNSNAQEVFTANCAGCHAKGGNILRRGKTLKTKALKRNHRDSAEAIILSLIHI